MADVVQTVQPESAEQVAPAVFIPLSLRLTALRRMLVRHIILFRSRFFRFPFRSFDTFLFLFLLHHR